jgi:hypothetical protein
MGDGMELEQYMKFRNTLTPASGFQSAQYRIIEFASTDLINLIDYRFRATIDRNTPYEHALEHLYWQAAGKDHATGEKSYLCRRSKKYKAEFLREMEKYNTVNLWRKFKLLPEADQKNPELVKAMRHYDHTVNINWVMGHLNAARKYRQRARYSRSHRRQRLEKIHASQIPTQDIFPRIMEPERAQKLGRRKINIAKSDLLKKIALFIILLLRSLPVKKKKARRLSRLQSQNPS